MRFNPDEYITVHERIEKFYVKFPQGRILTSIVEHNEETGFILMRAEVYRESEDALPAATGHAYELRSAGHVQAGSYVEVCETSSVGRALALLGFEVRRGVASREEVIRGARKQQAASAPPAPPAEKPAPERTAAAARTPAAETPPTPTQPEPLPRGPPPASTSRFCRPRASWATTPRRFASGSTRNTRSRAGSTASRRTTSAKC